MAGLDILDEVLSKIDEEIPKLASTEVESDYASIDQNLFEQYLPIDNGLPKNVWKVHTLESIKTFEEAIKFVLTIQAFRSSQSVDFVNSYDTFRRFIEIGDYSNRSSLGPADLNRLIEILKDLMLMPVLESFLATKDQNKIQLDKEKKRDLMENQALKDHMTLDIQSWQNLKATTYRSIKDLIAQALPQIFEEYHEFSATWKDCRSYALYQDWIKSEKTSSPVSTVLHIERMNNKDLGNYLIQQISHVDSEMAKSRKITSRLSQSLESRVNELDRYVMREPKKMLPKHELTFFEKIKEGLMDW